MSLRIEGSTLIRSGFYPLGMRVLKITNESSAVSAEYDAKITLDSLEVWGSSFTSFSTARQQTIAAGFAHSLAVNSSSPETSSGKVVGWGNNSDGQVTVPLAVQSDVVSVAGRFSYGLALTSSGKVIRRGWNSYGQTDVPSTLTGFTQRIDS